MIFLWQKLFCLSWIKIQNSYLISVPEYISVTDQQLQYIHLRQAQKCSELSQYLLEFFPIPYSYRTHCSDKSELAVCDRIWTLFLSKHVTFWVRHGFNYGFLVWGPQKRVNFRENFWDSQKSSEMPGHHATLGRTRPFPLKIVEFPAQTALYFLLGSVF